MGVLRKLGILGVATAAAVVGSVFVVQPSHSQQAPQYAPPPLSYPRLQYFKQNPQAFQQLLQSAPKPTTANPPPNNLKPGEAPVAGSWTTLTNLPGVNLSNPLLMTDGTVIAHQSCTVNWYKLTPDSFGSYVNGTWTTIGSLPSNYKPRFFGSAVLPDGRVVIEGGEYNQPVDGCTSPGSDTNLGAIYNPATNVWTAITPPSGWSNIGDATGIVLPNGTYMQTDCCNSPPKAALLNPSTLTWTSTGTGKFDVYDEEAIAKMQNNTLLTVDAYVFAGCGLNTEIYTPGTGAWTSAGNVPNQQSDCNSAAQSFEVGPLVTRQDGSVVSFSGYTGGPAGTAIYGGIWYSGASVPFVGPTPYTLADAPAAVLPNGNILFAASPSNWTSNPATQFPAPTHYFEMDLASNTMIQVPDTSWSGSTNSYQTNMLVLPTGQILATDIDGTNQIQIYTPSGTPQPSWAPTITGVPSCVAPGGTYTLSGIQLNGLTEGSYYGDDTQASVAFPIVRIVSTSGQVFYAKTFNRSNSSIQPGAPTSTSFTVPGATLNGAATLYAVAGGIPSAGVNIAVNPSCTGTTARDTHDFNGDGFSDIFVNTSPSATETPVIIGMVGATITWAPVLPQVPAGWTIVGQRDFDGDGKADILWRNTSTGNTAIWFMNGAGIKSAAGLGIVPLVWSVNGTCDFNGDGLADILWRDTSGNTLIWFMNGGQITSEASLGNVPTSWSIVGTGDFNGDGKCDILWRNNTGETLIWFMNGGTIMSEFDYGAVPTNWSVVGTGDFNGDGISDILWEDTAGDVAIWQMNGNTYTDLSVGNVPTAWTVQQTGDFNGDGKSDILWFNPSNSPNTLMWFMNGGTILNGVSPFSLNYPAYTFQNVNAD